MKQKQSFRTVRLLLVLMIIPLFCIACDTEKNSTSSKSDQSQTETQNKKHEILAWGEVICNDIYEINIDFPSIIKSLDVKEGDVVTNGQLLAELDIDQYKEDIKKLKAQVSSGEATLSGIAQSTDAVEADIAQLKKEIAEKQKALDNGTKPDLQLLNNALVRIEKEIADAQKDVNRYQELYDQGFISQSQLDQYKDILNQKEKGKADTEENIAKTKRSLQDEINTLQTSLAYKQTQLSQMQNSNQSSTKAQQSSISANQIDLTIAQQKLVKAYLKGNQVVSPIDYGFVQNINVAIGSPLGTQSTTQKVMDIADGNSIVVRAEVPEENIQSIFIGSPARIVLTSAPDTQISGTVTHIANIAIEKDGDRIIQVEVTPEDPKHLLRPGFTADVYFERNQQSNKE